MKLRKMIVDSDIEDVQIGPALETLDSAGGKENACRFEVFGYAFIAHKPG